MASHPIKLLSLQSPINKPYSPLPTLPISQIHLPFHSIPKSHQTQHSFLPPNPSHTFKIKSFSQTSQPPPFKPPTSREEAILQAKTCLSSTLQKPLKNPPLLPKIKIKKQRQPRFRVEIPVIDDTPESISQIAFEVFSDLAITKKGVKPNILLLVNDAHQMFVEIPNVVSSELASVDEGTLNSADLVVFVSPEASELDELRRVCEGCYPKPVVIFNPKWGFEEESGFERQLASFAASFEVIYSFMGLEVKGILSRKKGVVLRCVKDGVLSGEEWLVFMEDEDNKGEMKVVSRFKRRPLIGDVESVLYNFMAANSPVTKSVKFIRDLASNVTGKKSNHEGTLLVACICSAETRTHPFGMQAVFQYGPSHHVLEGELGWLQNKQFH